MSNQSDHDVERSGYELADDFLGDEVRAYTGNGAALRGRLEKRRGKFIKIVEGPKQAILNLDNTTSLTRR